MSTDPTFDSLRLGAVLPAAPERVLRAWLDAAEHAAMTGASATSEPHVGGRFTAWDGYIEGTHLEIVPGARLVQAWRSSDFPAEAVDSHVVITFAPHPDGCELTLVHTALPLGQGVNYAQGWQDFYFTPMLAYFAVISEPS